MPKDVLYGKTLRKSFAKTTEIQEMPNLLEIQKNSYQWFLDAGLKEVFNLYVVHRPLFSGSNSSISVRYFRTLAISNEFLSKIACKRWLVTPFSIYATDNTVRFSFVMFFILLPNILLGFSRINPIAYTL